MAMRKHVYAGRRSQNREVVLPDLSDESVAELATCLFDYSADPLKKLLRAEANARLIETLNQLAEQDREILVLRYLEQLSTAETAAVLKISQSAAKMRHLRALQRLRVLLDNQSSESTQ